MNRTATAWTCRCSAGVNVSVFGDFGTSCGFPGWKTCFSAWPVFEKWMPTKATPPATARQIASQLARRRKRLDLNSLIGSGYACAPGAAWAGFVLAVRVVRDGRRRTRRPRVDDPVGVLPLPDLVNVEREDL